MPFFETIEEDAKKIEEWFVGLPIVQSIKADSEAAIKELETIATPLLEAIVKTIGIAVLGGLAEGPEAAIEAGIAAAPAAFKAAEVAIASPSTIDTLVTTVTNQLAAQPAVVAAAS